MERCKTKFLTTLMAMFVVGSFVNNSCADTYTYTWQPTPSVDLYDLDHYKYYTWGIDWVLPTDEIIVGASIFFDNIRNWDDNDNDLYVHLLDYAAPGTVVGYDNQAGGDHFAGQGLLLNHWENLPSTQQDITYDFSLTELTTLSSYLADNNVGLGFDPDCHYYNDGITFTIETASVPVSEPATMLLFGTGLVGLAGVVRRRKV